jgi:hypothetical protein
MRGDGPDTAQAAFEVAGGLPERGDDDEGIRAAFDQMMAEERRLDREQEARETLQRRFSEGQGFLDDEED